VAIQLSEDLFNQTIAYEQERVSVSLCVFTGTSEEITPGTAEQALVQ
jgi:hypothetical protein